MTPAAMWMTKDVEPRPPALSFVLFCSSRKATIMKATMASVLGVMPCVEKLHHITLHAVMKRKATSKWNLSDLSIR
jgi:hypothetical protein